MSLGIIDWGIGGVSIYKLIKQHHPRVPVVYFSDTGVTPYGKMSRRELVGRLETVIEFLSTQGVTHIVIGCNAASTALSFLNVNGLKIEGVIDAAVEMTAKLRPKRLGLIGGRRTVVSGVYRRAFDAHGIQARQRVAQPLSGLIESGDMTSSKLNAECKRILAPLRNCSHVLLACTHYPAIAETLKRYVSPDTELIDPAPALLRKISRWKIATEERPDIFYTSGDMSSMKRSALGAFDCKLTNVKRINLPTSDPFAKRKLDTP